MKRLEAPFATMSPVEVYEPEGDANDLVLPPNARPVDFLVAVYRSSAQPMHRRLRAAIEAAPYVHPKLSVTAAIDGKSFAVQLEAAISRSGKAAVIEGEWTSGLAAQSADGGVANSERSSDVS